jgi:hypothetical protein
MCASCARLEYNLLLSSLYPTFYRPNQALSGVPVEQRCKCKPHTQEAQNLAGGK